MQSVLVMTDAVVTTIGLLDQRLSRNAGHAKPIGIGGVGQFLGIQRPVHGDIATAFEQFRQCLFLQRTIQLLPHCQ